MKFKFAWAVITAAVAFFSPVAASAVPITYTLQFFDASSGLPAGPFGTVTVGDPVGNTIIVEVALNSGFKFLHTGGHDGFVFNTDKSVTLGIDVLTVNPATGWTTHANGAFVDPPFATPSGNKFNQSITCCGGVNGAGAAVTGPLFVDVTAAGITQADFIANGLGYFFAVDILQTSTGFTGAVAAKGPDVTCTDCGVRNVPEPFTLSLFGAGLAGAAILGRRRKRAISA
jgi:hypothetical protein